MPGYETQFFPFSIASGGRQQTSEYVLAVHGGSPFSPEARKGQLFLLAEPAHESLREREACQVVLRTLRKAFYEDTSNSITSSLRKAISRANDVLYQQNFNTAAQKRVFVGVTCVVVRESRVYLAQVLPSQAYVLAEARLRAMPPGPGWSGGAEPASLKPNALGASLSIEPVFYQATMKPGDVLVVCSSSYAPYMRRDLADFLLRKGEPEPLAQELRELAESHGLPQAYGFTLALRPAQRAAEEAHQPRTAGRGPSFAERLAERLQSPEERERATKRSMRKAHAQRETEQLHELPEEPPPPPRPELQVRELDLGESLADRIAQNRSERTPRLGSLPARPDTVDYTPSSFLGEGDFAAPQSERPVDLGDKTPKETFTSYARRERGLVSEEPTFGERLAEPFTRTFASLRSAERHRRIRKRMPPSAMPQRSRRAGLSYRKEGPRFPWMQLAALILVVVLLVVVGYGQLAANSQQEQVEVLDSARQAVAALRSAPDEATASSLLENAGIALDAIRASGAISDSQVLRQEFLGLQREYERIQSSVLRISYLDDMADIGVHPQASSGLSFSSIVIPPPPQSITDTVAFQSIYTLDANTGTIYQMPKNGGDPEPMLQPGQPIADGLQAGQVKALAWRFDNVVAVGQIDSGYVYYFRSGNEWRSSNLGGSNEWRRDIPRLRFSTYEGNLYFWGPQPSQVLKYASGRPGDLFTPWIANYGDSNIESALDLAVDGNIYLLRPDGRVQVFEAGSFLGELPAPTLDPPIAAATDFVVTGEGPASGSIFLMEQNRIIQMDKATGALVQQLRVRSDGPVTLDGLTSFAVDTSGPQTVVYLVNHGHILRATLPQPPRPFQPGAPEEATALPATATP